MALVTTPAIVLQTYRYSETSKVVRLATRDLGVQSAIAKGALRPKSRFAAGPQRLREGTAQLYFRETPELHTRGAFDLVNLRRPTPRPARPDSPARAPPPAAARARPGARWGRSPRGEGGPLSPPDFWGRPPWVPPTPTPIPSAAS